MGKSSKKSTKVVDTSVAITPLPVKGKRDAEEAIEKVSAKKQKKNNGTVQAIEKLKSETKTQKKTVKKVESSSSEDESSESEEEQKVKAVKPSPKKPATIITIAKKKESSSDSDSSDDSSSEEDTKSKAKVIAPIAAKVESSSDSSDESDSEEDTKSKVIAPPAKRVESSSEDSSSDSDDDAPQPIQGKKVAPKADTNSDDSSSEEETDKKTIISVNKSSAAAKKKNDSSSDESSDEDSSEDEKVPKVVANVPNAGFKNLAVTSKDSESSEESSDDSDEDKKPVAPKMKDESSDSSSESDSEDDETPAKKPCSAAANGNNSKKNMKKDSSTEESSEDSSSEEEDKDEKPSKGQKKMDTDVEMVDAVTPKTEKKAPQTPVTPQDQSGGSKTLFVGNLPYELEQSNIENFFKEAGKVVDIRLASDREGNLKGFGHVEFEDAKAAQKALKLNGKELLGRQLKLDLARERGSYTPSNEKTPYQKSGSAQGTSLFVSGIDRSCLEDEVRDVLQTHFETCGDINRVSVPTDRESGEMRGIAFVDFADNGSLSKAIELGGPELGGYILRVSEAKPRESSGPRIHENRPGPGRSRGRDRERPGRGFDRSSGHKSDRFNKPSLATPGTGKKTTFDD